MEELPEEKAAKSQAKQAMKYDKKQSAFSVDTCDFEMIADRRMWGRASKLCPGGKHLKLFKVSYNQCWPTLAQKRWMGLAYAPASLYQLTWLGGRQDSWNQ